MSITPLPRDVIAQIKSSTIITSLNGVVFELVKNSLDAASTKVDINVDYARGGCVVEDDGLGIHPSEFGENGGLGKLYYTSKLNSQEPLHGHQGTFLAFLSAMALISITSHHHLHRSHNTLGMHKSEVISRQTPAPAQHYLHSFHHGTRVTVRDLFGSMPVRVKQRVIISEKQRGNIKDWERLKQQVLLLVLSWRGNVSVILREVQTRQKMVIRSPSRLSKPSNINLDESVVCSVLSQAGFIAPDEKSSWVSIGASTPKLEISGTVSLEPSATKGLQFLSFGIQPLLSTEGQSILHDEINRLFLASNFGNEEAAEVPDEKERRRRANDARYKGDGFTNRELKGGRKGVDRWPMFYINIQGMHEVDSRRVNIDNVLEDKGNRLKSILELLKAIILAFLTKHHFRPKAARGHRSEQTICAIGDVNQQNIQSSKPTRSHSIFSTPSPNWKLSDQPKGILKGAGSSTRPPMNDGPKYDLLGANVKLPSFRQLSSTFETPFDTWSRIKSGTARSGTVQQNDELSDSSYLTRPETAPPLLRNHSPIHFNASSTSSSLQRAITPLLSKSGEIIRRPFEDVIIQEPPSHLRLPRTQQQAGHISEVEDDMTVWVNPITMIKSAVDTKTGHTVPENKAKLETSFQTSIASQGRLTTWQASSERISRAPSPWIANVLSNWENPVFQPTELAIPQVSFEGAGDQTKSILHGRHHHCSQIDINQALEDSSAGVDRRISKYGLGNAEVVSQVDRKFILAKVDDMNNGPEEQSHNQGGKMVFIIDQHAADERIQIESLMEELCTPSSNPKCGILTTPLDKFLIFEVSLKEIRLLHTHKQHFTNWGILYDIPIISLSADTKGGANSLHPLVVQSLPPGIMERCKLDPRLLVELIRTEIWKVQESNPHPPPVPRVAVSQGQTWLEKIHSCPQGIIDLLNSRACRSAIMFNDELSKSQCEALVKGLSKCKFPFQCAHGRPSLVPLVDLGSMAYIFSEFESGEEKFGQRFRKWKEENRNLYLRQRY